VRELYDRFDIEADYSTASREYERRVSEKMMPPVRGDANMPLRNTPRRHGNI
jgi:hypothetical protein